MSNQRELAVDRALAARDRLTRLRRSPDFCKRLAAHDADAEDAFRHLTNLLAAGTDVAREDIAATEAARVGVDVRDVNADATALQAHQQSVAALVNDSDFRDRFNEGDKDAVRQWRELSVDGAAALYGVSEAQNRGPAPVATEQPGPGDVGSVTSGAAS